MRRCWLLFALFTLACWLPTTNCRITQARSNGSSNDQSAGWRRTALGWELASRWQLDAPTTRIHSPAMAVHPLVIASLELLISVGALVVASPSSRKLRR